jgi:hypothetical protein
MPSRVRFVRERRAVLCAVIALVAASCDTDPAAPPVQQTPPPPDGSVLIPAVAPHISPVQRGTSPSLPGDWLTGRVSNFALPDVNSASTTYNQNVSPRQFLGKISAYYFGHST